MGLLTDIHRVLAQVIARMVVRGLVDDAGGAGGDDAESNPWTPSVTMPAPPDATEATSVKPAVEPAEATMEATVAAEAAWPEAMCVGGRSREGEANGQRRERRRNRSLKRSEHWNPLV